MSEARWIDFDVRDYYKSNVLKVEEHNIFGEPTGNHYEVWGDLNLDGMPHCRRCDCEPREVWIDHKRRQGLTNKQIGAELHITAARVWQIIEKVRKCQKLAIRFTAIYVPAPHEAVYLRSILDGIEHAAKNPAPSARAKANKKSKQ